MAGINPLTYGVDASRDPSLALPTGTGVVPASATSALRLVIGAAFAIRGFRRPL